MAQANPDALHPDRKCVPKSRNPNPMYAPNSVHTDLNPTRGPDSHPEGRGNNEDCAFTQPCTGGETHQNSYKNSYRPASNDNNGYVKPHEDGDNANPGNPGIHHHHGTCEEAKPAEARPDNNSGDSCLRSCAVTLEKETAFGSADSKTNPCAVVKPEAGRFQDNIVESADNDGNPCIKSYSVKNQEDDGTDVGPADCEVIQPYAVKYQEHDDSSNDRPHPGTDAVTENGQTANIAPEEDDIQPYAVAYMDQDDMACATTSGDNHAQARLSLHTPTTAPNSINDVLANPLSNDANPASLVSEERQQVQNALHLNPVPVPNVRHPAACICHLVCSAVTTATVFVLCIVSGIFLWPLHNYSTNPPTPTGTLATTFTSGPTGFYSSIPTPPAVSNSSQRTEIHNRKMQMITFGGRGTEPGKFKTNYGVAVSDDDEMFVTDLFNNRVQVFSINGTYVRLFPTIVPDENWGMFPFSVAMDGEPGYLWVVGSRTAYHPESHVVQYSKNGLPIKKFGVRFVGRVFHPCIALDVRNNKVIVGEGDAVMLFHPNGSLVRSFQLLDKKGIKRLIRGVVSDKEGNILLTDSYKSIVKYSHSGDKMLEFGTKEGLLAPKGIVLDSSGHIIVAYSGNNRVDMFTSRGEFVRTVANITHPWGLAMGPHGQLVVTNSLDGTVTIFPRHMVFP
uniref:SMP-30/Gluconolactonase/LRE-like region domain-containing protein n=1 Tax=Branchiostoma floridae TaxID=7739 RepID=C3Y7W4_BRAFL|eukprot:XP_002607609.1 hypothetical protein BRAFLDRAFT_71487 [Branchiostoma floridae]